MPARRQCVAAGGSSDATGQCSASPITTEIAGAFDSDALDAEDLKRSLYDGAGIVLYLVDWVTPTRSTILTAGTLGEVSRGGGAFTAELRSLSHALNQPRGRLYQRLCDADLGDARCGVNLDHPDNKGDGSVIRSPDPATIVAGGLGAFNEGHFSRGLLTWTSGANDGISIEVKRHFKREGGAHLELVEGMPDPIEEGDTFDVTAGCAKTFAVCGRKFDNAVNFRGFPHMPGNDWLVAPARRGADNDGRALVRGRDG
jgi:uncharacterized phage protein (TIGR02218 family)